MLTTTDTNVTGYQCLFFKKKKIMIRATKDIHHFKHLSLGYV